MSKDDTKEVEDLLLELGEKLQAAANLITRIIEKLVLLRVTYEELVGENKRLMEAQKQKKAENFEEAENFKAENFKGDKK